jgi:hypothetical protein
MRWLTWKPCAVSTVTRWRCLRLDPAQWRTRIAANGIPNECLRCCRQPRLVHHRTLAPATLPAQSRTLVVAGGPQLLDPAVALRAGPVAIDVAVTPPWPCAKCFVGGDQPPRPLIEEAR